MDARSGELGCAFVCLSIRHRLSFQKFRASIDGMSALALTVRNFKALRDVRWEFDEGLSALVGPTGSGKSTLLSVLDFLRHLMRDGLAKAIQSSGGLAGLRHFDAGDEMIEFEVSHAATTWKISLPFNGASPESAFGETLRQDDKVLIDFAAFSAKGQLFGGQRGRHFDFPAICRMVSTPDVGPSLSLQRQIIHYEHRRALAYDIEFLRRSGSTADSEVVLSANGRSVWSTLRNWRDKRDTRSRYEFVLAGMRDAFPQQFADLEFEFTAQQVSARIFVPGRSESIPHHLFSDGWFTGLLHLCAMASANSGSIVSFDEPENSLHPHAVRSILRSFAVWSETNKISVLLATHSPVVLNHIKDRERVFVMEPGHDRFPIRLDGHPNHEWLSHFSIGDAYANEEVGAPSAAK